MSATQRVTFEVYEDASGEWRWRARSRNGRIVADSSEGYRSRRGAVSAAEKLILADKELAP